MRMRVEQLVIILGEITSSSNKKKMLTSVGPQRFLIEKQRLSRKGLKHLSIELNVPNRATAITLHICYLRS
jgi:hypothetical protein